MRSPYLKRKPLLSAVAIVLIASTVSIFDIMTNQGFDSAAQASNPSAAGTVSSTALDQADPNLSQTPDTPQQASPDDIADDKTVAGKVYHCNDGDTCRVQIANAMWMNVRLAGIDAPEVAKGRGQQKKGGQPYADEAKAYLNKRLQQQNVIVRQVDLDPFNRPVVEITLAAEKQPINLELIATGHAEMYRGKTKRLNRELYAQAEEQAKQRKLGIWALSDYQSPSTYRQLQKKNR